MPKLVLTFDGLENATISVPLPRPDFETFFVFGLHKSGSSMLSRIFAEVCTSADIPDISLPEQLFEMGHPNPDLAVDPETFSKGREGTFSGECTNLDTILSDGYCYRGFRMLPAGIRKWPALEKRKKILLVRDPRDAIVSGYFSFVGGSHRLPKGGELLHQMGRWREERSEMQIGNYARSTAPNYRSKLQSYREAFDGFDNAKVYRYEDIIFDKRNWIDDMLRFLNLEIPSGTVERIVQSVDVRPVIEDPKAHIRKVTPGDHREKLTPEIIGHLNAVLGGEMRHLGYQID